MCDVTSSNIQSVSWLINDMGPYEVIALLNGTLTGYSSNGNNLIVQNVTMNDVRNGSNYSCVINTTTVIQTILYIAGEWQYNNIIACNARITTYAIGSHKVAKQETMYQG